MQIIAGYSCCLHTVHRTTLSNSNQLPDSWPTRRLNPLNETTPRCAGHLP
jgi:hypothetical protein